VLTGLASLAEGLAARPVGWVMGLVGVALSLWLTGVGLDALGSIARTFAAFLTAPDSPDEER
jgi:4-hydroxybenzoate polyprenyltransferase